MAEVVEENQRAVVALRHKTAQRVAEQMRDRRLETYSEAVMRVIAKLVSLATLDRVRLKPLGVCITVFLAITLTTSLISTGAFPTTKNSASIWLLHAWAAAVGVLQFRASWFFANLLTETLSNSVVTSFRDPKDMRDALTWLRKTFGKRRQFFFCTAVSLTLTPLGMLGLFFADRSSWIDMGSIILSLICWFIGATGWYFLIPALSLSSRLKSYKLYLFEADPANSQAIRSICSMMHAALFVSASIATLFTTGIFLIAPGDLRLQIVFSVICAWGPMIFIMIYYQYSLAVVIRKAKAHALQPIERSLAAAQHNPSELDAPQIERLGKLMDLHQRIISTKDTALDWRGSFTTVNTLLLPLTSFLVEKISKLS